jgi:2-polyprenyl-3-methyl-5-hydroxy-6-metoxy-1,4-benzoquinol methylase
LKSIIDNKDDNSLAAINQFIKPNSHILEFGSSSGYFTRYLKEERQAIVDIVELDAICAETAAGYARDCCIGDIEGYRWKDAYCSRTYDYILFADVLEHLREPWFVLKEASQMLKPDGRIIISVPNVAHIQILASLYNNDFSYNERGILDNSHLRFFTEATMRHMIEEAGMEVCGLIPIQCIMLPEGCGTKWNNSSVPAKVRRILAEKQHAYTMQFVACCKKK